MLFELVCTHGQIQGSLPLFPLGQLDGFSEINIALIELYRFTSCGALGILPSLWALVLFKLLDEFVKVSCGWATISSFDHNLKVLLLHQKGIAWLPHIQMSLGRLLW